MSSSEQPIGPPTYRSGVGWTVTRYTDVGAVLADPRFVVPPLAPDDATDAVSWLRATVSRFCTGTDHERRRGLVVDALSALSPGELRRAAFDAAVRAGGEQLPTIARRVPVAVLAAALGVPGDRSAELPEQVALVAAAYHPGSPVDRASASAAVQALTELFGPGEPEWIASRIAMLVQACDATATLIVNAVSAAHGCAREWPAEAIVLESLRHDPPARTARRHSCREATIGDTTIAEGQTVLLDIAAAHRDPSAFGEPDRFDPARPSRDLAFGAGRRPCPGREHAVAIACGVVEAVLGS